MFRVTLLFLLTFFSFSFQPVSASDILELKLTSPSFSAASVIPKRHTCDGKNESPKLNWTRGPRGRLGTQSYAIILEDPDAPSGLFTHWILYDIPPTVFNIPKGFPPIKTLANQEKQGINDFGNIGYGGPCPPSGEHRYYFRIYALNKMLNFKEPPNRKEFFAAIEGHVLTEGDLMGRYKKKVVMKEIHAPEFNFRKEVNPNDGAVSLDQKNTAV